MNKIFTYGTLQDPTVQKEIIGKTLEGQVSAIWGFKLSQIVIYGVGELNKMTYPILFFTGHKEDRVTGIEYLLSDIDLEIIDGYEGDEYFRTQTLNLENEKVWVYVSTKDAVQHVFSYGTLQTREVQLENYGRIISGHPEKLNAYKLESVEIRDPKVIEISGQKIHPIAVYTGLGSDKLEGMCLEMTMEEVLKTDQYEVNDYQRQKIILASGTEAWMYLKRDK